MDEDKKKYTQMENVINKINQKYISLPEHEKKRNNKILEQATERITSLMKEKNILFRTMYERKFYGGSYYDGIKVGKPEEYDLDVVLNLPLIIEPVLEASDRPGFVQVRITEYAKMSKRDEAPKYAKLDGLINSDGYLSTVKVLTWMESMLDLALNNLSKHPKGHPLNINLDDKESIVVYATVIKAPPAFTLQLKSEDETISLDIDLVPCFQFTEDKWPKEQNGYRPNPVSEKSKFLVVPKKPYGISDKPAVVGKYWRLSFQEQERELMKGHAFKSMKPALKLLKKLRDKQLHNKIASYYIKTVFLWEVSSQPKEFWQQPLSHVFMVMLKKYADKIQKEDIPYFWNEHNNLIGHIKKVTINNIGNTLKNIIDDVERHLEDPFLIAKYLINEKELSDLRSEVFVGKKHLKKLRHTHQIITTSLPPRPTTSTSTDSDLSVLEEERKNSPILNDESSQEVEEYLIVGTAAGREGDKKIDLILERLNSVKEMQVQSNSVLIDQMARIEKKVDELQVKTDNLKSMLVKFFHKESENHGDFNSESILDEFVLGFRGLRNISQNRNTN